MARNEIYDICEYLVKYKTKIKTFLVFQVFVLF